MNVWTNRSPAACSESLAGILTGQGHEDCRLSTTPSINSTTWPLLSYNIVFPWDLCELLCSYFCITFSRDSEVWAKMFVVFFFFSVYKPWSMALLKDALQCTWRLKCIAPAVHWSRLAQKGVVIDLLFKSGLPHGFFQGIISMSLGWQDMKLRVFLKFSFTPRGVTLLCGNRGKLHPLFPVCSGQDNLMQCSDVLFYTFLKVNCSLCYVGVLKWRMESECWELVSCKGLKYRGWTSLIN